MKSFKTTLCLSLFCSGLLSALPTTTLAEIYDVIPVPNQTEKGTGVFTLTNTSRIYVVESTPETLAIGQYLADKVKNSTGFQSLRTAIATSSLPSAGNIVLQLGGSSSLGEEGYTLNVAPAGSVVLTAYKPAGLFRGIQTIRQLLPAEIENQVQKNINWTIPAGSISDSPLYAYRSSSLDVGRMFYSVNDVKKYIDGLAYYKYNKFHFHLTEREGWRIAIQSRPKLGMYGTNAWQGAYSQDDFKDIVKYAKDRYIEVIPEIDVPGHTNALIATYPELQRTVGEKGALKINNFIHYQGKWSSSASPNALNQDVTYSESSGDTYSMIFNGNRIKIFGTKGPNLGIMELSVDGVRVSTLDLYSQSTDTNALIFDSQGITLNAKPHVIKVSVTGKKNSASSGFGVGVDHIDVVNGDTTTVVNDSETGTYGILEDVFRELALISPSPYIHIGGDEASDPSYRLFVNEVKSIVEKNGKKIIGWDETNVANLDTNSTVQLWTSGGAGNAQSAAKKGAKIILSPCNITYLDYGYVINGTVGSFNDTVAPAKKWVGCKDTPSLEKVLTWNPMTQVPSLNSSQIIGIEAVTWGDTMPTYDEIEQRAFPKLPGLAEAGWSSMKVRDYARLKERMADHGERLRLQGHSFYPVSEILWINEDKSYNIDNSSIGNGFNQFEYIGEWTHQLSNGAYAYSKSFSATPGSSVKLRFKGTKATLFSATAPGYGVMAVSIDGGNETIVNLKSGSMIKNTPVFSSYDLVSGEHIMNIRMVSGTGLVDRVAVTK